MKKRFLICAVCLVCACTTLFFGCAKGNKFEMNDGKYMDSKTKISYIDAPACYEPIAKGEKIYGSYGDASFYEIVGIEPTKWICSDSGVVLYAEGETLPSLREMNVSRTEVMLEDVRIAELTAEVSGQIIDLYSNGERISKPMTPDDSIETSWSIRFADESRGIYYVFEYFEMKADYVTKTESGEEINHGKKFFYNRFESVCVEAGDVLESLVDEYKELLEEEQE